LPLDFEQYLEFKIIEISKADSHIRESEFWKYLQNGGLPGYVLTEDASHIKQLVEDIIYKDIAAINGIRQLDQLKDYRAIHLSREM